jgi:hypothetical protein
MNGGNVMQAFRQSISGRLIYAAVGLPLVTGGLVHWSSSGHGVLAVVISLLAGIALTALGIGLGVDDHPWQAMRAVVLLPPALLLYFPLVIAGVKLVPAAAYAMVIVGSVLIARAIWTPRVGEPRLQREDGRARRSTATPFAPSGAVVENGGTQ